MSIGANLAEARQQAGLSVTQVSQRTCIRETIIRGIEQDDYAACGGDFYARGHIRSIARAVGTDPGPLIDDFDAGRKPARFSSATDLFGPVIPIEPRQRRGSMRVPMAAVLVVVLLAAGVYYFLTGMRHTPARPGRPVAQAKHRVSHPRAAPSTSPTASAPVVAADLYAHTVAIRLKATTDCWVEFTTPQGGYLFQSYVYGGAAKSWVFRQPVEMQIGNPAGISLTVDGKHPLRPGTDQPVTLHLGLHAQISGLHIRRVRGQPQHAGT